MTTLPSSASGPCAGLKVLDLSAMVSGPMCGQILADLGADVIKLEPMEGDSLRNAPPVYKGLSAYFNLYNRRKKSIVVNLKSEEGRAIAKKLASDCDLLIENFRPGVAERLGMDYERLRAPNPGLVYLSIKGFGEDGPDSSLPVYDPVIQALAGFMVVQGAGGEPVPIANAVADKISAVSAAHSALAALWARERNGGKGQKVIVKMIDAWTSFISQEDLRSHSFLESDAPVPPKSGSHRVFKVKDGYVMALMIQDSQFEGMTKLVNRPDLFADPRFKHMRERMVNSKAMTEELAKTMATMTTGELTAGARKYDVPLAKVHTLEEFLEHPQARHNNTFPIVDDPEFGPIRSLTFPAEFLGTPLNLQARSPLLGEHTDEILQQAGIAAEEIRQLRVSAAVR